MALILYLAVAFFTTISLLLYRHVQHLRGKTLPGPKGQHSYPRRHLALTGLNHLPGLPFLGSVLDLPHSCLWMKFVEWGHQYGHIYQVNLAGTTYIILCSEAIANDLLGKRAAIYSDRPQVPSIMHDSRNSAEYLPLLGRNGELPCCW